jgi:hypothetical protein
MTTAAPSSTASLPPAVNGASSPGSEATTAAAVATSSPPTNKGKKVGADYGLGVVDTHHPKRDETIALSVIQQNVSLQKNKVRSKVFEYNEIH